MLVPHRFPFFFNSVEINKFPDLFETKVFFFVIRSLVLEKKSFWASRTFTSTEHFKVCTVDKTYVRVCQ